jgi:hypothetical protein
MLLYGTLWTVGWLVAGWFVRRQTKPGSRDRKLRPLAYLCFAAAAVPVVVWLAYFAAGTLLILSPNKDLWHGR